MYISNILSGGFGSKVKIVTAQLFVTLPYFCWQLAFYRHLPTSGWQNTVKTALQPLFVNRAFVPLYVSIISPVGPIPISISISRRQIFACLSDSTFWNIWQWVIWNFAPPRCNHKECWSLFSKWSDLSLSELLSSQPNSSSVSVSSVVHYKQVATSADS